MLPFPRLVFLCCAWLLPYLCVDPAARAEDDRPVESAAKFQLGVKANPALPTLYLVGDSTVRTGHPMRGWGDELAAFFDPARINVVNHAIGGRSSRTFQNEGRWDASRAAYRPGDFVLIQFGHNDPGAINDATRARGSLRGGGGETQEIDNLLTHRHEVVHTYGWYIRKYVRDARAAGATPVVCSPIPRMIWKDGRIARADHDYGQWAREAAAKESAAFVDLNEIVAREYEKLGPEAVKPLFADEHTHTSPAGAQLNARCVVAGLKGLPGQPVNGFLSAAGEAVTPFVDGKPAP